MERKIVLKYLKLFSIGFLVITILELIIFFLFSFFIVIKLDSMNSNLYDLLSLSGNFVFQAYILWYFLLSVIILYIILSFSYLLISIKKKMDDIDLARYLLITGVFVVSAAFIKMEYIYLIARIKINYISNSLALFEIIYDGSMMPILGIIYWFYFMVVVCCFLISGLIFGGVGLRWLSAMKGNKK